MNTNLVIKYWDSVCQVVCLVAWSAKLLTLLVFEVDAATACCLHTLPSTIYESTDSCISMYHSVQYNEQRNHSMHPLQHAQQMRERSRCRISYRLIFRTTTDTVIAPLPIYCGHQQGINSGRGSTTDNAIASLPIQNTRHINSIRGVYSCSKKQSLTH